MKLLVHKGIQATPMSAIAKAAGTGMGTIYNYFATKEELINAIYLYIKQAEVAAVTRQIDPNASLKVRFMAYYTAFIQFNLRYPESFAFMEQMQHSPIIQCGTREEGKSAFMPVIDLIKKGQQEGIIKPVDIEAILYFLAGTLSTYVRWLISSGKEANKTLLEQHLRMVWDGIKE